MKVIAVPHESYSKGLVDSVQMLVGEQENLVAYGLFPEQTVATLTEQLEREVNDTPEGEEILFLTDLFHGTESLRNPDPQIHIQVWKTLIFRRHSFPRY